MVRSSCSTSLYSYLLAAPTAILPYGTYLWACIPGNIPHRPDARLKERTVRSTPSTVEDCCGRLTPLFRFLLVRHDVSDILECFLYTLVNQNVARST